MGHIKLVRQPEEHAVTVFGFAFRSERRPCRVIGRKVKLGLPLTIRRLKPMGDIRNVACFSQRTVDKGLKLRRDGDWINGPRLLYCPTR